METETRTMTHLVARRLAMIIFLLGIASLAVIVNVKWQRKVVNAAEHRIRLETTEANRKSEIRICELMVKIQRRCAFQINDKSDLLWMNETAKNAFGTIIQPGESISKLMVDPSRCFEKHRTAMKAFAAHHIMTQEAVVNVVNCRVNTNDGEREASLTVWTTANNNGLALLEFK